MMYALSRVAWILVAYASLAQPALAGQIFPGGEWLDGEGAPIQAHGGGLIFVDGRYYWFGENKSGPTINNGERVDFVGISVYSSVNLVDWKNEGFALPAVKDDPSSPLHTSRIGERPKVLYNDITGKYVMWLHTADGHYQNNQPGVAVADKVTGPYRYLGSHQVGGSDCADLTVFKDDDGRSYIYCAGMNNKTLMVSELTPDYLAPTSNVKRIMVNESREAPTVLKHKGLYYLVTSGLTGWNANKGRYDVAKSPLGPWTNMGNPYVGLNAEWSFFGQATFAFKPDPRGDQWVLMMDRWTYPQLGASKYVWLPVHLGSKKLQVPWVDEWDVSEPLKAPENHLPPELNLAPRERIVLYGENFPPEVGHILEAYLRTRAPQVGARVEVVTLRDVDIATAAARLPKMILPLKPTLVLVSFAGTIEDLTSSVKTIQREVRRLGARAVFVTPMAVNTLGGERAQSLGQERQRVAQWFVEHAKQKQLPVIDVFGPMTTRPVWWQKNWLDKPLVAGADEVTPRGAVLAAYLILRQLQLPRALGTVRIRNNRVSASGVGVEDAVFDSSGVSFTLELPHLPLYVPSEWSIPRVVNLDEEINALRVYDDDRGAAKDCRVLSKDKVLASGSGMEFSQGINISGAADAPWVSAAADVWQQTVNRAGVGRKPMRYRYPLRISCDGSAEGTIAH